jgi:hypothetical protein
LIIYAASRGSESRFGVQEGVFELDICHHRTTRISHWKLCTQVDNTVEQDVTKDQISRSWSRSAMGNIDHHKVDTRVDPPMCVGLKSRLCKVDHPSPSRLMLKGSAVRHLGGPILK